jgi:hypothetical protein|tara:strand:- start:1308 stop:1547 length:240 start_codon:yes stop_codon:yes gene_type:complete
MSNENNQQKLNLFVIDDVYTACGIIENFVEIPDDVDVEQAHIKAWQFLIDTGACWSLQGFYGRTAESLIEQGICTLPTK